jgi:PAS domain S-box-containing protein
MREQKSSNTSTRALQLLLVGNSENDCASLHDLLNGTNHGQIHLDHASSPSGLLAQTQATDYDLILCSNQSSEDTVLQLLRRVRQDNSGVPVVILSDQVDLTVLDAVIQAGLRHRENHHQEPLSTTSVPREIDPYAGDLVPHKSETMLRKLSGAAEQSGELVVIVDRSRVMECINPAFETLTGYSPTEAVGRSLEILKPEQAGDEPYEEMWNTVVAGKVFRGIVTTRKKNGQPFTMEAVLSPGRDAEGTVTHFIYTGRDLSDQRRMQSELQQSQKMDAVGRLAGGVAHDFNNLLLVISAYAELMLDSLAEADPLRRNVNEIMTASRRAADLTRQLLAFGRKQVQSLQVLDLNTAIGEIVTMLPRLISEDIQLVFLPGQDLGKVRADPIQIEQIVMNLATNARDAMPRGGKLTIETATVQVDELYVQRHSIVPAGEYVLLAVTDSGEGIAAEHLPHIFEPFYTTKEAGKGTGLGLATVYGIVKQNSGFVWVYSEPGLGTTFKIYLPRVPANNSEAWIPKAEEDSRGGSETLLLVEDETAVRESTRQFLTRRGYTVLEASDGEDAHRTSREHRGPIHLMISDVVMPKMGGPQLAEQLACERPNMKVLFVSGYAENTVLQHGHIDITSRFLQKPFSLKTLARKVRDVLEASESLAHATTSRG